MKNIILDTDLGTDSDDIGALAILCNLHKQGKINLVAVTSCSSTLPPVHAILAICNCYGVKVAVGKSAEPYGEDAQHGTYARAISCAYPQNNADCVSDSVKVLRKSLLVGNITLVTIGPLNNISHLLNSVGDEISPLSGKRLFAENVREMYSMAGNFSADWTEFNVQEDVESAKNVFGNVTCPITFVPFEVGIKVKSGKNFLNGKDCPMKLGYFVHNISPRESWDPITAYCAAVECLPTSEWGVVKLNEKGATSFRKAEGKHRYVLDNFDVAEITQKLEDLMVI